MEGEIIHSTHITYTSRCYLVDGSGSLHIANSPFAICVFALPNTIVKSM